MNKFINIRCAFIGATVFWLPFIISYAIEGKNYNGTYIPFLTIWVPIAIVALLLYLQKIWPQNLIGAKALSLLCGIWLLSGLAVVISWTFCGAGFFQKDWIMFILLGIFPPTALMMLAYHGSLGALIIASGVLISFSILWGIVFLTKKLKAKANKYQGTLKP